MREQPAVIAFADGSVVFPSFIEGDAPHSTHWRDHVRTMRCLAAALVVGAFLLGSQPRAQADPTLYTDRAAFNAATTGLQTVTSGGIAPSPTSFTFFATPPGLTLAGV